MFSIVDVPPGQQVSHSLFCLTVLLVAEGSTTGHKTHISFTLLEVLVQEFKDSKFCR